MPSSYVTGEHFEVFIAEQVRQGRYATASEVVRAALRALEEKERHRVGVAPDVVQDSPPRGTEDSSTTPAGAVVDGVHAATRKPANRAEQLGVGLASPAIVHLERYVEFIKSRGVGSNDLIASSPDSYVSYLRSVSKLIGAAISPDILRTEQDIRSIARRIDGRRAANTINNYCSAMRQYTAMVSAYRL